MTLKLIKFGIRSSSKKEEVRMGGEVGISTFQRVESLGRASMRNIYKDCTRF